MSLNTTPKTWVPGPTDPVTAAQLNTEIRDAFAGLQAAWDPYVPVWTSSGTAPNLGNGSFAGSAYMRVGKVIHFRIVLTMGSTTTYGTGVWALTLPVAPLNAGVPSWLAGILDSGTGHYTGRMISVGGAAPCQILTGATTPGNIDRALTPTVPHAWAVNDVLTVSGTYEAA